MKIEEIRNPKFVKNLSTNELKSLAADVRSAILEIVSEHGGHLSSNLGVVELTIALHKEFDFTVDRLVMDVGHQSYPHKILTGRYCAMKLGLRELHGVSGYQKRTESEYDHFEAGHAGTALSAALGMKVANPNRHVIALVGDSSMANGMSMEALNHLGHVKEKLIIIYNDNGMGISTPVGGTYRFFSKARSSRSYQNSKYYIRNFLLAHWITKPLYYLLHISKEFWRRLTIGTNLFENMGLFYLGPIDGHDFRSLSNSLEIAKRLNKSVVLHVMTQKGKGYAPAQEDPHGYWHGVEPFDPQTGSPVTLPEPNTKSWSAVIADIIGNEMQNDDSLRIITPAMSTGSKLEKLFDSYPDRCFDVGIAESHAVTLGVGMASSHLKPIISIYSTFLQRAYDQVIHDAARMNLSMTFIVDRSGVVGNDGETHQGIFDAAYLRLIPNCTIVMPSDEADAQALLLTAINQTQGSFFIRIPRGKVRLGKQFFKANTLNGMSETMSVPNSQGAIIVTGPTIHEVIKLRDLHKWPLDVMFARYYHPLEKEALTNLASKHQNILIIDRYSISEGFALPVENLLRAYNPRLQIKSLSLPKDFIEHGDLTDILQALHLDADSLATQISDFFNL